MPISQIYLSHASTYLNHIENPGHNTNICTMLHPFVLRYVLVVVLMFDLINRKIYMEILVRNGYWKYALALLNRLVQFYLNIGIFVVAFKYEICMIQWKCSRIQNNFLNTLKSENVNVPIDLETNKMKTWEANVSLNLMCSKKAWTYTNCLSFCFGVVLRSHFRLFWSLFDFQIFSLGMFRLRSLSIWFSFYLFGSIKWCLLLILAQKSSLYHHHHRHNAAWIKQKQFCNPTHMLQTDFFDLNNHSFIGDCCWLEIQQWVHQTLWIVMILIVSVTRFNHQIKFMERLNFWPTIWARIFFGWTDLNYLWDWINLNI